MGRRDRFATAVPLLGHRHYSSFFTQLCWLTVLSLISSAYAGRTTAAATRPCSDAERDALLAFKSAVSDPSDRLSSWDSSKQEDCCRWSGVVCRKVSAAARSYVVELNLANPVDRNWETTALQGHMLPRSLLSLTHLEVLDLSYNNFGGGVIPEYIVSFRKLRHLDLGFSNLGGTIPSQLGNLSSLRYLNLSGCGASLAAQSLDWLTRLSALAYLDMSSVNLSAVSHNWLSAVSMLPSLRVLSLSDCRLHRQSPFSSTLSHLNLTSLAALDLSYNNFQSTIPSWLWQLTALSSLNLSSTNVHGAIPAAVGNLSRLAVLDLRFNSLGGAPLPVEIGNCTSLTILYLDANQVPGPIPVQIGKLSNLRVLNLSFNLLSGVVSQLHFANLTSLVHLDLSGNSLLTVAADQNWLPPFQLHKLHLGFCMVGPEFPWWLRSQRVISSLDMTDSGIEDAIPDWFWIFSSLEYLDLSLNRITGTLGMINFFAGLQYLNLSRNYFQGEIPNTIGQIKSLETLDLSFNNISGAIPHGLLALEFLSYLNLSYNNLSGTTYRFYCETLDDTSIYQGNTYLCVSQIIGSCLVDKLNKTNLDEKHEKFSRMLSFYIGITLGVLWALWIVLLLFLCLRKHERISIF